MKYGLNENTLESIIDVFAKRSKIERVLLYGSRAKGNYRNGSDIDLALVGENINIQDLIDHINRIGITIYTKNIDESQALL